MDMINLMKMENLFQIIDNMATFVNLCQPLSTKIQPKYGI